MTARELPRSRALRAPFVTTVAMTIVGCSSPSSSMSGANVAGSGSVVTAGMSGSGGSGGSAGGEGGSGGSSGTAQGGVAGNAGGGGNPSACPGTKPAMNDVCSPEGLVCPYPSWVYGCTSQAACLSGRWVDEYLSNGFCNPPSSCPLTEPPAGAWCHQSDPYGAAASYCRYPHGACFTYWTCNDAGVNLTSGPAIPSDSCCPAVQPVDGAPCSAIGAVCTYGQTRDSACDGTSWTSGSLAGSSNGGASAGGSAGASGGGAAGGSAGASGGGAASGSGGG